MKRILYKQNGDIREIIRDGFSTSDNPIKEGDDVEALVASEDAVLFNSEAEMKEGIAYQVSRARAYPSVLQQLDQIYHEGIDAWKASVKKIKDDNPKP